MNIAFARRLITDPSEETVTQLFDGVEGVIWVDWREEDEAIIQYTADSLNLHDLKPKWIDDQLFISLRNQDFKVPLKFEQGDRDITLIHLNAAIAPDYEIRFVRKSEGGDTLAFMAFDSRSWRLLEMEFGQAVEQAFERITSKSAFFS